MAETDFHRILMTELIETLGHRFRDDPMVYVSGNLFVYFEEGHPEMVVAPDVFVARGARKGKRRIYKVWEEKKGPDLVIELTSEDTHLEDLGKKRAIYERLRIKEYIIFDPEGIRFDPQLRAFRLQGDAFQKVEPTRSAAGALVFHSEVLGLELHGRGQSLRLVDPRTGETLPTPAESYEAAEREMQRAEAEMHRARKEKRRAEKERERAEAAEAQVTKLRKEIARLRKKKK
jgi:Uma2 family endonuclease